MSKYIYCNLVKVEPMTMEDYCDLTGYSAPECEDVSEPGYKLEYEDGAIAFIHKDIFVGKALKLEDNPKLPSGVSVGPDMVNNFIKETHAETIGDKTTLVRAVLVNGFEVIESSACVDKANYSEEIGVEICLNKIKDKIWYLLGFLLQTAVGGVK